MNARAGEDAISREIEAARSGDAEVLGRVLQSCREYLVIVASRGLGTDLTAKGGASDLVQETFLGAYRDFDGFHGHSRGELLAWLRQILMNNVANFTRRYRGTEKREVNREVVLGSDDSAQVVGPVLPVAGGLVVLVLLLLVVPVVAPAVLLPRVVAGGWPLAGIGARCVLDRGFAVVVGDLGVVVVV